MMMHEARVRSVPRILREKPADLRPTDTPAPDEIELPPLYEPVWVERTDSAGAHAERLARHGAGEGTLVWTGAQDADLTAGGTHWFSPPGNLHCALVLEPEFDVDACMQLGYVAMTSMGAALSAKVTPMTAVTYRLPGQLALNGLRSGRLQLTAGRRGGGEAPAPERPFDYLVLAWAVNVARHPPNPEPERYNALHASGAGDVTPAALLEAYARHFLSAINRWAQDGFEPVRRAWLDRADGIGERVLLAATRGEAAVAGTVTGLDERGRALVETDGGRTVHVESARALAARTGA